LAWPWRRTARCIPGAAALWDSWAAATA